MLARDWSISERSSEANSTAYRLHSESIFRWVTNVYIMGRCFLARVLALLYNSLLLAEYVGGDCDSLERGTSLPESGSTKNKTALLAMLGPDHNRVRWIWSGSPFWFADHGTNAHCSLAVILLMKKSPTAIVYISFRSELRFDSPRRYYELPFPDN